MRAPHDFGRFCEDLACRALTGAGWHVLHRNFRLGHKEIDVVARRGSTVVFVEVKGRRSGAFGHPLEAVTAAKRREIARVASSWIRRHGRPGDTYRFDAVAVFASAAGIRLEHVENAWRL